ncbi:MAG: primosomal protein N' [Elusimicrobiota bacterium]|jgi:primosomal protein N' (replication factor Y)|nr:primosomal protein N' [Elusimicrobiota bacterium]
MYVAVSLPIALNKSFDYAVPPQLEAAVKPGLRVKVPFGAAFQTGCITELNTKPNLPKNIKIKEIAEILDDKVYFGPDLFPLAKFIETAYANTLGETLGVLLPSFINKKLLDTHAPPKQGALPLFYPAGPLTAGQKNAAQIVKNNQITLFEGDAFTGKTEAALNLAYDAVSAGGQVLILVPDIISSAELIEAAQKKFGAGNIHMWHSKVLLSRRKQSAAEIITGRPCIVIGTRSACLLPFVNLKLSLIFREEDEAYKQEESKPYYHSREVLTLRAGLTNSKLVLISQTPSLETLLAVKENKIKVAAFTEKIKGFDNAAQVIITQKSGAQSKLVSDELYAALRENLLNAKQSLVIINRLGYGGAWACLNCRALAKCKKCGAVLSRAQINGADVLVCKKCRAKESPDQICPACKNEIFRQHGAGGTQAAAEEMQKLFPSARVLRLDSQTLAAKDGQGNFVSQALAEGGVDIVVGTIMALRAGLLKSKISLITLLDADTQLNNSAGFRTAERFAQMLFNLKGRLSKERGGKFIIQITDKDIFDFNMLRQNAYAQFADLELEFRKEFSFPPYTKIVKILMTSKSKKDLNAYSQIVINAINTAYGAYMRLEGPVQAGAQADKNRQQYLLVKSLDDNMLKSFIKTLAETKPPKKLALKIIADPYNFI